MLSSPFNLLSIEEVVGHLGDIGFGSGVGTEAEYKELGMNGCVDSKSFGGEGEREAEK